MKKRHLIYKRAISLLINKDNVNGQWFCLCSSIKIRGIIEEGDFPELDLFKPYDKNYGEFWFNNLDDNQDHRANCLMLMYEMSK